MPRKRELTWQSGSNRRAGRWKKKYRGKVYYFDGGNGKTDHQAYADALSVWKKLQADLDASQVKPHEDDYLTTIADWTAMKEWATNHGDADAVGIARSKIQELQRRLSRNSPPALKFGDRVANLFEIPPDQRDALASAIDDALRSPVSQDELLEALTRRSLFASPTSSEQRLAWAREFASTPLQVDSAIWADRIKNQRELNQRPQGLSIGENVDRFKEAKRVQVEAGQISPGRYDNLSRDLDAFRDFAGGSTVVSSINSRLMTDYRTDLLARVGSNEFGETYAKDRLDAAKQFVRWLWHDETLSELPRIIDSKGFSIRQPLREIKTFTLDEVRALLTETRGRLRLYILLALNTGMTQKEISDIAPSEVLWKSGQIRRKRSKTRQHQNVPVVTYSLWPETLKLLKEYQTNDSEHVILSENGTPLVVNKLRDNGTTHKVDSIQRAFYRLKTKLGIKERSFKTIRKTSATMLKNDERFSAIDQYFLGQSPRSVSDRHYSAGPDGLLRQATEWLRSRYDIESICCG
ncbi:MAG: tyrosine-type recombinase/integrase [Planctomycetota bacterium]|nr:tyrosine-type recombinase/integrase [Planctomycetota bacterium]